jgi:hypothetical protein
MYGESSNTGNSFVSLTDEGYLSLSLSMVLRPWWTPVNIFKFVELYRVSRTLWMGYQSVARPLPAQRTHTDIHASSGIRTHDPNVRAGEHFLP